MKVQHEGYAVENESFLLMFRHPNTQHVFMCIVVNRPKCAKIQICDETL